MSSCAKSKTSWSRRTARSAGASSARTTRNAIVTSSRVSSGSIPASARSTGSGSRSARLSSRRARAESSSFKQRRVTHRDQDRPRRADLAVLAPVPADPGVLHHVLGTLPVAQHAIGEGRELHAGGEAGPDWRARAKSLCAPRASRSRRRSDRRRARDQEAEGRRYGRRGDPGIVQEIRHLPRAQGRCCATRTTTAVTASTSGAGRATSPQPATRRRARGASRRDDRSARPRLVTSAPPR